MILIFNHNLWVLHMLGTTGILAFTHLLRMNYITSANTEHLVQPCQLRGVGEPSKLWGGGAIITMGLNKYFPADFSSFFTHINTNIYYYLISQNSGFCGLSIMGQLSLKGRQTILAARAFIFCYLNDHEGHKFKRFNVMKG